MTRFATAVLIILFAAHSFANELADKIAAAKAKPSLGVMFHSAKDARESLGDDPDARSFPSYGTCLTYVDPHSTLGAANLKPLDIVYAINGEPTGNAAEFMAVSEKLKPGAAMRVQYKRNASAKSLSTWANGSATVTVFSAYDACMRYMHKSRDDVIGVTVYRHVDFKRDAYLSFSIYDDMRPAVLELVCFAYGSYGPPFVNVVGVRAGSKLYEHSIGAAERSDDGRRAAIISVPLDRDSDELRQMLGADTVIVRILASGDSKDVPVSDVEQFRMQRVVDSFDMLTTKPK